MYLWFRVTYGDTFEGMHTEDQALVIRKLYDEYSCDYIVLDCTGLGLGVYDALVRDMVDPDTGEVYPALSCCNNQEMADRCTTKGADKVIWAIKGSPMLNSECAVLLREGFRSSKIRLLITEYDGEALLSDIKGYYVIVPPDRDAKEIMALIVAKAESLKLTVSKSKSRIVPLTKPFRYCKAKFILTETGRVVMNGNRDGVKRARRKIKAFRTKIQNGEMSYDDLWTSVNGMLAYFESYDDHNRVLRLRRLFYSVFGFSPERIENFRERGKKDEICCA